MFGRSAGRAGVYRSAETDTTHFSTTLSFQVQPKPSAGLLVPGKGQGVGGGRVSSPPPRCSTTTSTTSGEQRAPYSKDVRGGAGTVPVEAKP